VVEIVQGLAKILKIKWKLHTAYRPQSSRKVERMNRTLKITLAKLPRDTIPLDRHATIGPAQGTLYPRPSVYSPFEILYGKPPPIINRLREKLQI
jgi:hypothetical protein